MWRGFEVRRGLGDYHDGFIEHCGDERVIGVLGRLCVGVVGRVDTAVLGGYVYWALLNGREMLGWLERVGDCGWQLVSHRFVSGEYP